MNTVLLFKKRVKSKLGCLRSRASVRRASFIQGHSSHQPNPNPLVPYDMLLTRMIELLSLSILPLQVNPATMTKLLPLVTAILSAPQCSAFVAHGPVRTNDVSLNVKLDGRDIDGPMTPSNNFLLVKLPDVEDETEGGIFLTGSVSNPDVFLQ